MIFALDVGNTHIVTGCISEGMVLFTERISTRLAKTELEYAIDFKLILELHNIEPSTIEGCILSSVVPPVSHLLCEAVRKVFGQPPLVVGP